MIPFPGRRVNGILARDNAVRERLKSTCARSLLALMLCLSIIMNVVIITGAAGLIGSESVKRFARMYESKLAHR